MLSSGIYLPLGQAKLRSRQLWAGCRRVPGQCPHVLPGERPPSPLVLAVEPVSGSSFGRQQKQGPQPSASKLTVWDSRGAIYIYFLKGTFFKNLCISCQMDGLGCFSNPSRTGGFPYQRPEPEQRKSQGLYLEP